MGNEPDNQPPNSPPSDPFQPVLAKLDAIEKRLATLEKPPAPAPKPDANPEIKTAETAFRELLSDSFPKDKLDAMNLQALMIAHDVKKSFKPPTQLPAPPVGKGDSTSEPPKPLGYYSEKHGGKH